MPLGALKEKYPQLLTLILIEIEQDWKGGGRDDFTWEVGGTLILIKYKNLT